MYACRDFMKRRAQKSAEFGLAGTQFVAPKKQSREKRGRPRSKHLTAKHPCFILPRMPVPETIIVVHPRERRAKCTVQALRNRQGFVFYKHPRIPQYLAGYVRLGLGGPLLSPADAQSGLLVLDGTWRWVEPMERLTASVPVRSLPPLVTAYPRSSKVSEDPEGGLATIEALYAAYRILGRDTSALLDHYRWGQEFIELNRQIWPTPQIGGSDSPQLFEANITPATDAGVD
jgi:pre-rRNA-processing protein TSR3